MRKYGTGEIIREDDDVTKTANKADRETTLAEVQAEAKARDEEAED